MSPTDKGPISFRCAVITLALYLAIGPATGLCQSPGPQIASPPLPAAAQEAIDKGIIAAKVPDYLLAIRFFEDARKLAPDAPVIFFNLGLAESKIPGRELRAIAWFGAFLAANPTAPNAAAVKEQIAALGVKAQSNLLGFIKSLEDAALQTSGDKRSYNLRSVAGRWALVGDFAAALNTVDLIQNADDKGRALAVLAEEEANSGDTSGVRRSIDRIPASRLEEQNMAQYWLAKAQANSGDFSGARRSIDRIPAALLEKKSRAQYWLARGEAERGDIEGAKKTVDVIQDPWDKSSALVSVARAQIKASDFEGALTTLVAAQKTADYIQNAYSKNAAGESIAKERARITAARNPTELATIVAPSSMKPAVTVADWLHRLDDDVANNQCALKSELFLDWARYLESLPRRHFGLPTYVTQSDGRLKEMASSENPQSIFEGLDLTASRIWVALFRVNQMLQKQGK